MVIMGILACKMLQDEIVHLIQNDSEISDIIVVKNEEHTEFVEKLESLGISYRFISNIEELPDISNSNSTSASDSASDSSFTLVVWQLDLGLHEMPILLKKKVYEYLPMFMSKTNGILLFYGLCGNVLGNVESDFKSETCPVMILRDKDGIVIDDCIGGAFGGREEYAKVLKSFGGVGTFIFTPMYATYAATDFFGFGQAAAGFTDEKMYELNKFMFESSGYKQVANLKTGLHYTKNVKENIQIFADKYQLNVISLNGGHQRLFEDCYQKAKEKAKEKVKENI